LSADTRTRLVLAPPCHVILFHFHSGLRQAQRDPCHYSHIPRVLCLGAPHFTNNPGRLCTARLPMHAYKDTNFTFMI
jgi:hypothetical protein